MKSGRLLKFTDKSAPLALQFVAEVTKTGFIQSKLTIHVTFDIIHSVAAICQIGPYILLLGFCDAPGCLTPLHGHKLLGPACLLHAMKTALH